MAVQARIDRLDVSAYIHSHGFSGAGRHRRLGQDGLLLVRVYGCGQMGLGYSYADLSTARLIDSSLKILVEGGDALSAGAACTAMTKAVRNTGRAGVAAMAISAVDVALWDLKARISSMFRWPICWGGCGRHGSLWERRLHLLSG